MRHLEGCDACRLELEELEGQRKAFRSLPRMKARPGMELEVLKRLPAAQPEPTGFANNLERFKPAFAAVAVALIAGLGLGVLMGQGLYTHALAPETAANGETAYVASLDDFDSESSESFSSIFSELMLEDEEEKEDEG